MSLSARAKNAVKIALADLGAANEVIQALGADAGLAQNVGTGDAVTFAGVTSSADIAIASGHVLKVGTHQVVGAQQTAVTPVAVTFTTAAPATYASPTGALTISNGGTPTVAELVAYCDELRKNIVDLQAVLHAHGLTS